MRRSRREALAVLGLAALATACSQAVRERSTARVTPSPPLPPPGGGPRAGRQAGSGVRPVITSPREVDHGPRGVPSVALTFHGSGDPGLAEQLLSVAEHRRAALTVFAVGSWLEAYPRMSRRVLSGGHELANHTYHHYPMANMPESEAYAEISGCAAVLHRLSGSPGRWFRPSGTPHATRAILTAAGRVGYDTTVGYDVDSLDYTDPGAEVVRRRVRDGVRAGSVVSLHLGHAGTVGALAGVLDDLHARGLTPVTVSHLLEAPPR